MLVISTSPLFCFLTAHYFFHDFFLSPLLQTVSFLTYLLKSFAEYIRPHEESICKSIVNLLVTCSDSVSIRKASCVIYVLLLDLVSSGFKFLCMTMWNAGVVGSLKTCFGHRFQEGFVSFD